MLDDLRIAFIGGGNMARSLVGGLRDKGVSADRICVCDPSPEQRTLTETQFHVRVTDDGRRAVDDADVVVFAVKPQVFRSAAEPLAGIVHERQPLIVSVAAGVAEPDIRRWLGGRAAIVRAMPNTPALVGAGAAALYANPQVTPAQRTVAQALLEAVGTALWITDESLMDAVTAVSGSGPAYYFLLMELMETAARELHLPADVARQLTLQTAYGAARMALESSEAPVNLRKQVTSPGGTTAAALKVFEESRLDEIVRRALTAARDRGRELAREAGEKKT